MHNHHNSTLSSGNNGNEDEDKSSLEAAAEAAAKVNAMLIAKGMLKPNQIPAGTNVITKKAGGPNSLVVAEVEINNLSTQCRNTLTRGTTQEEISRASGAAVTTRGRYMAPDERARNIRDRCLYLNVQASTKESVDTAVQKIHEIIRDKCGEKGDQFKGAHGMMNRGNRQRLPYKPTGNNKFSLRLPPNQPPPPLMSLPTPPPPIQTHLPPPHMPPPQPQTVTIMQEKLYIGLEHAPPNFDTKNKILGPGSSFLQHIQAETGGAVSLRGKGSGFGDANGPEAFEPMHIHIEHPSLACLQEAKKLAENLIQTVQQSYVSFQQALAAMPPSIPTGLMTGLPQQSYMEHQLHPRPELAQLPGMPEPALQQVQPQEFPVQQLCPPTILMPAGSVANQGPQAPQMVIPQSISLNMPLVNNLPVSATSMIPQQPGQLEVPGQQPVLLTQQAPPGQPLTQMVQTLGPPPTAVPAPQPVPAPMAPLAYTHVQPTVQVVSQAPVSMALQQPNVSMAAQPMLQQATASMAPPGMLHHQPNVSMAPPQGLIQQQTSVAPPPPTLLQQPNVSMAPPPTMLAGQPNVSMPPPHPLLGQPNVSVAPPAILQPPNVSMAHTELQQPPPAASVAPQGLMQPPVQQLALPPHSWQAPVHPAHQTMNSSQLLTTMSVPASVVYTVASSTAAALSYSSPNREIGKRRFTEEKEDKIPDNVLGYQHGPPHLVNLLRSSPPPSGAQSSHQHHHQQLIQVPPPSPGLLVTEPPPQSFLHPQHHLIAAGQPAAPAPHHVEGQALVVAEQGPTQFVTIHPAATHSLLVEGHADQAGSSSPGGVPASSGALMPPPPPPSPLASQNSEGKKDDSRGVMPPPKSPDVPWDSNHKKRSSPHPQEEPEKKKIRGILKNKPSSERHAEPSTEGETSGESTQDEQSPHPASPQYQGQPLRYPTMPSDPNLPPTSQESGLLHHPGLITLPSDPNLHLTSQELHRPGGPTLSLTSGPNVPAVHLPLPPGHHIVHQIDPNLQAQIHLSHHQPVQLEQPRPVAPPPSQILVEHSAPMAGQPIQITHRLAAPPPGQLHMDPSAASARQVLIEHQAHPPPQVPMAPPPAGHHPQQHLQAPGTAAQEMSFEFEANHHQLPPAPPQFQNFDHVPVSQPGELVIVSSTQPFPQYSTPMSSAGPASFALPTSNPVFSLASQPQQAAPQPHVFSGPPPPPPGAGQYSVTLPPPSSSQPQFQPQLAGMQQTQALPAHLIPQQAPAPIASQHQYQPHPQGLPYWANQA